MLSGDDSRAFAAVDLGAGSGRVMLGLYRRGSLEIDEVHRFANGPVNRDGEVLWDTPRLFAETVVGLTRAVERAWAELGTGLSGIGVDSWGVDYALVDPARGFDGRSKNYLGADPAEPERAQRFVSSERAYEVTGVLTQHINTAYQLRSDAASGAAGSGSVVLLTPDLWVYLLTGQFGAEHTIASTTQLLDPSTGGWSDELIASWGLDAMVFPEPSPPGTPAGHTTADITRRIGATHPVPVYRVAQHDTASALAFATPGGGELLVSSGSWSLAGMSLTEPIRTAQARDAGYTNELGVGGNVLLLRNLPGMLVLAGCVRQWSEADGAALDSVELITAAGSSADDGSVTAVFDIADARLLSTDDMAATISELCVEAGYPPPVDRLGVVRAIVESLATAYAEAAASSTAVTGVAATSIRIVGGGSRNAALCQRTAQLAGLPVVAGPAEASALGNIAVQLVASATVPTIAAAYAAAERTLPEVHRYEPEGR